MEMVFFESIFSGFVGVGMDMGVELTGYNVGWVIVHGEDLMYWTISDNYSQYMVIDYRLRDLYKMYSVDTMVWDTRFYDYWFYSWWAPSNFLETWVRVSNLKASFIYPWVWIYMDLKPFFLYYVPDKYVWIWSVPIIVVVCRLLMWYYGAVAFFFKRKDSEMDLNILSFKSMFTERVYLWNLKVKKSLINSISIRSYIFDFDDLFFSLFFNIKVYKGFFLHFYWNFYYVYMMKVSVGLKSNFSWYQMMWFQLKLCYSFLKFYLMFYLCIETLWPIWYEHNDYMTFSGSVMLISLYIWFTSVLYICLIILQQLMSSTDWLGSENKIIKYSVQEVGKFEKTWDIFFLKSAMFKNWFFVYTGLFKYMNVMVFYVLFFWSYMPSLNYYGWVFPKYHSTLGKLLYSLNWMFLKMRVCYLFLNFSLLKKIFLGCLYLWIFSFVFQFDFLFYFMYTLFFNFMNIPISCYFYLEYVAGVLENSIFESISPDLIFCKYPLFNVNYFLYKKFFMFFSLVYNYDINFFIYNKYMLVFMNTLNSLFELLGFDFLYYFFKIYYVYEMRKFGLPNFILMFYDHVSYNMGNVHYLLFFFQYNLGWNIVLYFYFLMKWIFVVLNYIFFKILGSFFSLFLGHILNILFDFDEILFMFLDYFIYCYILKFVGIIWLLLKFYIFSICVVFEKLIFFFNWYWISYIFLGLFFILHEFSFLFEFILLDEYRMGFLDTWWLDLSYHYYCLSETSHYYFTTDFMFDFLMKENEVKYTPYVYLNFFKYNVFWFYMYMYMYMYMIMSFLTFFFSFIYLSFKEYYDLDVWFCWDHFTEESTFQSFYFDDYQSMFVGGSFFDELRKTNSVSKNSVFWDLHEGPMYLWKSSVDLSFEPLNYYEDVFMWGAYYKSMSFLNYAFMYTKDVLGEDMSICKSFSYLSKFLDYKKSTMFTERSYKKSLNLFSLVTSSYEFNSFCLDYIDVYKSLMSLSYKEVYLNRKKFLKMFPFLSNVYDRFYNYKLDPIMTLGLMRNWEREHLEDFSGYTFNQSYSSMMSKLSNSLLNLSFILNTKPGFGRSTKGEFKSWYAWLVKMDSLYGDKTRFPLTDLFGSHMLLSIEDEDEEWLRQVFTKVTQVGQALITPYVKVGLYDPDFVDIPAYQSRVNKLVDKAFFSDEFDGNLVLSIDSYDESSGSISWFIFYFYFYLGLCFSLMFGNIFWNEGYYLWKEIYGTRDNGYFFVYEMFKDPISWIYESLFSLFGQFDMKLSQWWVGNLLLEHWTYNDEFFVDVEWFWMDDSFLVDASMEEEFYVDMDMLFSKFWMDSNVDKFADDRWLFVNFLLEFCLNSMKVKYYAYVDIMWAWFMCFWMLFFCISAILGVVSVKCISFNKGTSPSIVGLKSKYKVFNNNK